MEQNKSGLGKYDDDKGDGFEYFDELNKEEAANYYQNLHWTMYGKRVEAEDFTKFWGKVERKGLLTENKTITQENMLKENVNEWRVEASFLQDV